MASEFIATEFADGVGLRWQSQALLALQEASEAFLVHLFEDAYIIPMPSYLFHLGICALFMLSE